MVAIESKLVAPQSQRTRLTIVERIGALVQPIEVYFWAAVMKLYEFCIVIGQNKAKYRRSR